jgi:hypothetical protein
MLVPSPCERGRGSRHALANRASPLWRPRCAMLPSIRGGAKLRRVRLPYKCPPALHRASARRPSQHVPAPLEALALACSLRHVHRQRANAAPWALPYRRHRLPRRPHSLPPRCPCVWPCPRASAPGVFLVRQWGGVARIGTSRCQAPRRHLQSLRARLVVARWRTDP